MPSEPFDLSKLRDDRDLAEAPVEVVLVEAYVRSGSTLLGRILGEIPGYVHLGELGNLWLHGVKENDLCGCGKHFFDCPFWLAVGQEAYGGWDKVDIDHVLALDQLSKQRFLPLILAPWIRPGTAERLADYSDHLSRLYRAIRKVSNCPVIVDSKKSPTYALIVRRLKGVNLKMIHLVRDSRGVAYSMTKTVRRPEATEKPAFLRRLPPAVTALTWAANNIAFGLMKGLGDTASSFARYEAIIASPKSEISRITSELGLQIPAESLGFIGDGAAQLGREHTISGNPMRFNEGSVKLKLDDAWRKGLPNVARLAVTVLTGPLLLRYGYLRVFRGPRS